MKAIILSSDLLATVDSADFYFALCGDVPTVSVQPNVSSEVEKKLATYAFKGVVPVIKNPEEVEPIIQLTYSEEYKDKIQSIKADGQATNRVVELVRSYL